MFIGLAGRCPHTGKPTGKVCVIPSDVYHAVKRDAAFNAMNAVQTGEWRSEKMANGAATALFVRTFNNDLRWSDSK